MRGSNLLAHSSNAHNTAEEGSFLRKTSFPVPHSVGDPAHAQVPWASVLAHPSGQEAHSLKLRIDRCQKLQSTGRSTPWQDDNGKSLGNGCWPWHVSRNPFDIQSNVCSPDDWLGFTRCSLKYVSTLVVAQRKHRTTRCWRASIALGSRIVARHLHWLCHGCRPSPEFCRSLLKGTTLKC